MRGVMCTPDIDSILTRPQAQQTLRGLTACCQHTQAMDFLFIITIIGFIIIIIVVTIIVVAVIINTIITSTITTVITILRVVNPCRSEYGLAVFAMNVDFLL